MLAHLHVRTLVRVRMCLRACSVCVYIDDCQVAQLEGIATENLKHIQELLTTQLAKDEELARVFNDAEAMAQRLRDSDATSKGLEVCTHVCAHACLRARMYPCVHMHTTTQNACTCPCT